MPCHIQHIPPTQVSEGVSGIISCRIIFMLYKRIHAVKIVKIAESYHRAGAIYVFFPDITWARRSRNPSIAPPEIDVFLVTGSCKLRADVATALDVFIRRTYHYRWLVLLQTINFRAGIKSLHKQVVSAPPAVIRDLLRSSVIRTIRCGRKISF